MKESTEKEELLLIWNFLNRFWPFIRDTYHAVPERGLSLEDVVEKARVLGDEFDSHPLIGDLLVAYVKNLDARERETRRQRERMMKCVTWSGRLFVEGPCLSPEQYKMFFSRSQNGIPFAVANDILRKNAAGDFGEVVPGDELNGESIDAVREAVMSGSLSGKILAEGQELSWRWTPEFKDYEGNVISFDALRSTNMRVLIKILHDMLDNGCRFGIVNFDDGI